MIMDKQLLDSSKPVKAGKITSVIGKKKTFTKYEAKGLASNRSIGKRGFKSTVRRLDKPKETRSFKFDPDVYVALKLRADKENRSLNNLAETLLWNEVKAELK